MKTTSINRKKAMKARTFILALVLLPALSFAMMPKNSNLLSTSSDQYVTLEEEKTEDWMSDLTTWSNEVSDNIESEEEMAIEEWMVDVNHKFWHTEVAEEEMAIEEWMYNLDSDFCRMNF